MSSKWLNKKYRVTPESSKVLQELVIKEGIEWKTRGSKVQDYGSPFLYIDDYISRGDFKDVFDGYNLEDGTQMLEEYMKELQEQEDGWEECGLPGIAGSEVKLETENLTATGFLTGIRYQLGCILEITLVNEGFSKLTIYNPTTLRIYKRKPKREIAELNGKTYYKDELEKALSNLKEAEV